MPEDNLSQELQELHARLAGNETFARLRGHLASNLTPAHFLGMITAAQSPTEFNTQWDRFSADVRVMGNLLKKLKRDGKHEAALQLQTALTDPGFIIAGEDVPLENTLQVTLVIPDFQVVLQFVDLLNGTASEEATESLRYICQDAQQQFEAEMPPPNEWRRWSTCSSLGKTMSAVIMGPFLADLRQQIVLAKQSQTAQWLTIKRVRQRFEDTYLKRLVFFEANRFVFVTHGLPKETLRHFSRKFQKRFGMWTLRLPSAYWRTGGIHIPHQQNYVFELIPETETAQLGMGDLLSPSISHGYRCVFINQKYAHRRRRANHQQTSHDNVRFLASKLAPVTE